MGAAPTLHDLQMDKGFPPPPNPSRLANGQGLGAPTLHDLQMDKGWGPPTLHDLQMDNGWTRVGAPRSSPHYQHWLWTRVGPPQPFAIWGGSPNQLYRFNIRFQADQAPCPKMDKSMTGPFGPERTPTQTSNFVWTRMWLPNHRTLEHISQGTGSVSTDRNINDKPFVPECTLEQVFSFA